MDTLKVAAVVIAAAKVAWAASMGNTISQTDSRKDEREKMSTLQPHLNTHIRHQYFQKSDSYHCNGCVFCIISNQYRHLTFPGKLNHRKPCNNKAQNQPARTSPITAGVLRYSFSNHFSNFSLSQNPYFPDPPGKTYPHFRQQRKSQKAGKQKGLTRKQPYQLLNTNLRSSVQI